MEVMHLAFRHTPGDSTLVVGDIQYLFRVCHLLIRVTSVRPCSLRLFVESFRPEVKPRISGLSFVIRPFPREEI